MTYSIVVWGRDNVTNIRTVSQSQFLFNAIKNMEFVTSVCAKDIQKPYKIKSKLKLHLRENNFA